MTIEIRRATSASDLTAAFTLRRDVFVGEGIVRGTVSELMHDIFDAIEETTVFVAVEDGEIIGTARVTESSPLGFPGDDYFDFRPHLPDGGVTAANGSMLCVAMRRRRSTAGIQLLSALYEDAILRGCTHITGAMRPQAVVLVERTGGAAIGPEFDHPVERVPVVPVVTPLAGDVAPYVARLRRRLGLDHASEGEVRVAVAHA